MNGYWVDTNVPPELTRERPDARVGVFLKGLERSSFYLGVLTVGEICKGISALPSRAKHVGLREWFERDLRSWFAGRILPITEQIAERWGDLAAAARQQGTPVAVVDGLIAATAIEPDLTLVTRNAKDFVSTGAKILNPWKL